MKLRLLPSFLVPFFALMLGAVIVVGCSAITGAKPSVVISSPPSGSAYKEGDDVAIQSTSGDPGGIVRVELTVDGAVVRNDTPPSPQTNFSLIQTWKATQGSHTIIVRAYNAAGTASDPAAISIQVNASVALDNPTPTATGASAAASPTPTSTPTNTPSAAPPGGSSSSSSPAPCTNNAAFVTDVTVPDGTVWAAGQAFNKIWRLSNNGTCAWDAGYQFVFISGEAMTANTVVNVPPTAPGATADILVAMTAPAVAGNHAGQWRLRSAAGAIFGQSVTVKISVPGAPPPAPPAGCTGTPVIASFTVSAPGVAEATTITVFNGSTVTLHWGAVTNADSVEIDHGIGGVPAPGTATDTPGASTSYVMTAHCGASTTSNHVTVNVAALPPLAIAPSVSQVLKQITVAAGASAQAIADCPSGTKVTGGGFAAPSAIVVSSNAMQANGWESAGKNNSGSSQLLNAYAICAANISGTVSQVFSQVSVAGNATGQAIINCPAGTVLTGGGYAASPQQQVYSDAIQGSNGWESAAKNMGGSSDLLNAHAVCYSGSGASSSFVLKQVSIGAGANGNAKADCPSGTLATGGGYAASTGVIVFNTSQDGNSWHSYAANTTGSPQGIGSYAICTHF